MTHTTTATTPAPLTAEETARAERACDSFTNHELLSFDGGGVHYFVDSAYEISRSDDGGFDVECEIVCADDNDGEPYGSYWVTIRVDAEFKVLGFDLPECMDASAREAANDAYTYNVESGWRSAME